ncbi:heterokaryon incompatibility protein-domain-containing protein [Cadophora sp. MPI-SDFR-AT-0126]|nr:heterokaryon incompatibility protein-domain-containing protein [Leotiomycetes sp. MPI-SDFR-AT-0126]
MRLLKCNSVGELSLTQNLDDNALPPYAILSHTWGEPTEEVTFRDLMDGTGKGKAGYDKIRFCGGQAKLDGLHYFWVDTCCIDRSDSAELQTSINSMFRWYKTSIKCYVCLSDVRGPFESNEDAFNVKFESAFRAARWFTRGWTLQELIAPSSVEFFDMQYKRLGDKVSLERMLHERTGIPVEALQAYDPTKFSLDERISWVAERETKYPEDKAYSLCGIMGIFLPLIYGEGQENAFRRLRERYKEDKLPESHIGNQSIFKVQSPRMIDGDIPADYIHIEIEEYSGDVVVHDAPSGQTEPIFPQIVSTAFSWLGSLAADAFVGDPTSPPSNIAQRRDLCERLFWEDIDQIPEGYSSSLYRSFKWGDPHVYGIGLGKPLTKCWAHTLRGVYSEAWKSPQRQMARIPKPPLLDPNLNYICTDIHTLMGFFYSSHRYGGQADAHPHSHFDIRPLSDGTLVTHLTGGCERFLTKRDIEGLLSGYPPWYRYRIQLDSNRSVPSPIKCEDDVYRAGWLIALGLNVVEYIPGIRKDGRFGDKPVKRMSDIFQQRLVPAFQDDRYVRSVGVAVLYMWSNTTNSGASVLLDDTSDIPRQKLSNDDAIFAMRFFNEPPNADITPKAKAQLAPIVRTVARAAYVGVEEVLSQVKNHDRSLGVHYPLDSFPLKYRTSPIFVKDCDKLHY